ncbi:hypothetical protein V6R21_31090 [Limibacter armeniacum]|uniref:hypothetical protein n=1 Tax=Limibacter armeniacum TaxID=466084 RepID=UPI002FE5693E
MKKAVIIAFGTAAFVIGVHQSFYYGIGASYWLFMLSGICVLLLQYINKKNEEKGKNKNK